MDFLYHEGDHVVLWVSGMNDFIGKEGVIISLIDEHGRPMYRVNFYEDPLIEESIIDYWYVEEDWIEPANHLEIDTSEIDSFLSEFGGDHNE